MRADHSAAQADRTLWDQSSAARELRLIAACIDTVIKSHPGRYETVLDLGEPDWILFLTLALEHNVASIVAAALAGLPADRVPQAVLATLAVHRRHTDARNRAALDEQRRLLDALGAAGVPGVPLKGAWLCLRTYRDIAARPSRDLDFLVPAASVARALPVLERCGYEVATGLSARQFRATLRDDCEFMFPRQDRRFVIEPHWAYVPRNLAMDMDMDGIWRRVGPVTVGEATYPTLGAEDEVILLCVHGGKEEWARLKWLADLAAFVAASPGLDWSVVAARAREAGVLRSVLLGVLLLHQVFSVRTKLAEQSERDPVVRRLAAELLRRIGTAAAARRVSVPADVHRLSWTRMKLRERTADQLRYVVRTIVTPRRMHFILVPLPVCLHSLYFAVKVGIDYMVLPIWLIGKRALHRMGLVGGR
jgi:hypothetical protein